MATNVSAYKKNNYVESNKVLEQEGRVPPQAVEVEEAVLGAMLIENGAAIIALGMLATDDFYKPAHRHIFEAIKHLSERDNPLDLLTIENELRDNNLLDACGGPSYLSDLTRSVSSAANIEYHSQIIIEKAVKRNLILNCTDVIKDSYDTTSDAYDVLDDAEQRIFDLANNKTKNAAKPVSEILKDTLEYLEDMRGKEGGITGVPTGLAIDQMTAGWQKGDLIIIAARPSMGKTAFVLTAARNAAMHHDESLRTSVALFSLEMSNQSLVQRLLTMEARVNASDARKGTLNDESFKQLIEAASNLHEADIFIDDTPAITLMELRTKCRRLKSEHDVGLIVIDYLQLMQGNTRDTGNREQEIASISRGLKSLAKELDVPVVALSQLSRAVEQRGGDKRPQLSDLRESGCITGDSLIPLVSDGKRVPVKDLLGKKDFKVWSLNNKSKKIEASEVSNVFSTGIKPVYELETQLGRAIKATANHKFLTINGWKRLDQIQEGECVALPRKLNTNKLQTLTNDQLGLLGHLIGDGCTLPRHSIQYTTRENDLAKIVKQLALSVFGNEVNPRISQERSWYQVYLKSTRKHTHGVNSAISDWLQGLKIWGLRSYEKKIPEQVFSQPDEAIAIFLKHLWATDGSILMRNGKKPYPSIYYATSSNKLAEGVQSLLLRLGINARVKKVSQGKKGRDQYHVIVGGKNDISIFINKIGTIGSYKTSSLNEIKSFLDKRKPNTNRDIIPKDIWGLFVKPEMNKKQITHRKLHSELEMSYSGMTIFKKNVSRDRAAKVAKIISSDELNLLSESDIYWDKISSKIFLCEEEVYDLTVPKNHNFVANDIFVHNSIEQDADVVMFLYRPEYYKITTTEDGQSTAGLAEVIVGKQRNGPVGSRMHYFVKDYARFENLTTADTGGFLNEPKGKAKLPDNFDPGDSGPPPMPHNPTSDEGAPF
tara:strand:+ start:11560 stop:14382 length:2823 start_codon:yes stop_codon:yes gene_type:complete